MSPASERAAEESLEAGVRIDAVGLEGRVSHLAARADGTREPACDASHRLEDLLEVGTTTVGEDGAVELALEGYGHRWLRVVAEGSRRLL